MREQNRMQKLATIIIMLIGVIIRPSGCVGTNCDWPTNRAVWITLLDNNNNPIAVWPGGRTRLGIGIDRSHCTHGGAVQLSFEYDLDMLSSQPVDAQIESNHFLGPAIGPC